MILGTVQLLPLLSTLHGHHSFLPAPRKVAGCPWKAEVTYPSGFLYLENVHDHECQEKMAGGWCPPSHLCLPRRFFCKNKFFIKTHTLVEFENQRRDCSICPPRWWPALCDGPHSVKCASLWINPLLTCKSKTKQKPKEGFHGVSVVKDLPANAGNMGSIPDPGGCHMLRNK